jgi:hypothetical protein
MTWLRKAAQFLGLVYRDDGSWKLGPVRQEPTSAGPDSEPGSR